MGRIRRGRILRDTSAGDGLVFVDGKQYLFRLEGMWESEFAPKINMLVDVEFDDRGQLTALRTAPAEAAAAEQTAHALNAAKAATRTLAQDVRSDTVPALARYVHAIGYPTLAAMAALLLGWFYFSVASMDIGVGGRLAVTFYQTLKLLNVRGIQDLVAGGSAGIYGLLCFLCCGAVLLPWLWHDRRSHYGMLAPLVFMVLVGTLLHHKLSVQMSGFENAASQFGSRVNDPRAQQFAAQFANSFVTRARNSMSLDFGAWLSLAGALYLAWRGIRQAQHDGDQADPDAADPMESAHPPPPASDARPAPRVAITPRMSPAKDYFENDSVRGDSPSH